VMINMLLSTSHYDILQIKQDATNDEIKRSFRILALKYHPDKNKSSESKEKFLRIVEAYEVLSDAGSRKKYDLLFQSNRGEETIASFSTKWTPSADYAKYYSYNDIKNWYTPNNDKDIQGGMWDIGEKANKGMWKTTLILFGSLAVVTLFIIMLSK
ncbi:MAG: J domain-containing protein, partial [Thermoproteota archaeon]|nr:J domain-containing protein [Thermoproteota archaeon]